MYETIPQQLRTAEAQYKRLAPLTRSLIHQAARAIEDLVMQCHGKDAAISGMKTEIERMVVIDADKNRAIEDLTRQRDRAYARLCEWCGVCPPDKRNPEDCEIAEIGPEAQKAEDKPRWIPVKEQKPPLPEDEDICFVDVIAAIRGRKESAMVRYCRAYRYRDGKRERIERFVDDAGVVDVTRWQPLPAPPKEEA